MLEIVFETFEAVSNLIIDTDLVYFFGVAVAVCFYFIIKNVILGD